MKHPDIIVVGVGRTGTSTIARLLHEDFGVHMANRWDSPECNPKGSYEDQIMMKYSRYLTERPDYDILSWLGQYEFSFGRRGKQLVGLKCCQLSLCSRYQWEMMEPRLVIRTFRPLSLTVDSMKRWREPKNEDHWVDFYRRRERCLELNLDCEHAFPVLRINFTSNKRDDLGLKMILDPWVRKLENGTI